MTAPVIRQYPGTIPDKGQAQTAFDTNVDAFLDWQALQFAPDLVAFGTWADGIRASLIAGNLPSLTGRNLDAVRVNAAGNDVEFADVTAAGWALLDDANAAAQRVTLGAAALASPTFTGVPAAPTAAAATNTTQLATTAYTRTAIPDVLNAAGSAPMYACRAWVNFNGTGTVAIRASGNVSSITDNGTGDYTVNFTTAMEDANYAWVGSCMTSNTATNERGTVQQRTNQTSTTTALPISTMTGINGTASDDVAVVNIAIFR
jgi:hypothetical protein